MSKPFSGRTQEKDLQALKDLHAKVGTGVVRAIDAYLVVRPIIIEQVKKLVDGDDIRLLARVLSDDTPNPSYMGSPDLLISKIQLLRDHTDDKRLYSNLGLLTDKIRDLTPVQCYFLQEELFRRMGK